MPDSRRFKTQGKVEALLYEGSFPLDFLHRGEQVGTIPGRGMDGSCQIDEYEAFSEMHGWETQEASRVAFNDLPEANRQAMLSTVRALIDRGVIAVPALSQPDPGDGGPESRGGGADWPTKTLYRRGGAVAEVENFQRGEPLESERYIPQRQVDALEASILERERERVREALWSDEVQVAYEDACQRGLPFRDFMEPIVAALDPNGTEEGR